MLAGLPATTVLIPQSGVCCLNKKIRCGVRQLKSSKFTVFVPEQVKERKLQERFEERRKFPLEDRLRQHIIGQEGPITTVAAGTRVRLFYSESLFMYVCTL